MLLFYILATAQADYMASICHFTKKGGYQQLQRDSLGSRGNHFDLETTMAIKDCCSKMVRQPTEPVRQPTESLNSPTAPVFDFDQMKRPIPDLLSMDTLVKPGLAQLWLNETQLTDDKQLNDTGLLTALLVLACLVLFVFLLINMLIPRCTRFGGQTKKTGMVISCWNLLTFLEQSFRVICKTQNPLRVPQ